MPRGRPAKGNTKSSNGPTEKSPENVATETALSKAPAAVVEPKQGNRSSMRLRGQSNKAGDNHKETPTAVAEQKKKPPGRKRKEKSEESTGVPVDHVEKKDEAGAEEPENTTVSEEEPKADTKHVDASQAPQEGGEIKVNRAPVLTMWVTAVAERQGFTFDEAVTFGKAISGLFAQAKGKKSGIFDDSSKEAQTHDTNKSKKAKTTEKFDVFGNRVCGKTTEKGRFAVESGKAIAPNSVKAYLHRAFKDDYDRIKEAFEALANSLEPEEIGGKAYHLYEKFRPEVPDGARGWGARGLLDLKHVQELAATG